MIFLALAVVLVAAPAGAAPRTRVLIDADWRFHAGDLDGAAPALDDSGWRRLDLPHDWGIEGPFAQEHPGETGKLPWWGVAWYRKRFELPAGAPDRRTFIEIDGAMSHAEVWLNGQRVGGWPYGYASFRLEVTAHVRAGANLLAIRLDNPARSSRWYPGGGLYRHVWLTTVPAVHVADSFVTTPQISAREAQVKIDVTLTGQASDVTVRATIDRAGRELGRSAPVTVTDGTGRATLTIALPRPRLWSPATPNLYRATTTIERAGQVVDRHDTTFGVRSIRFDADRGFFLNDVHVPIRGVCLHHDLGPLGAAFNLRALTRQLEMMKAMGANAIRTSHNPPAPELLELTDRMGLLVVDELVDAWKSGKTPNDYSQLYRDWYEKDLRALIRRDRNHPSVIAWSTGNEVKEQKLPDGAALSARHTAIAHEEDPTRPVTAANNSPAAGLSGFQKTFDVFGANYHIEAYQKFHQANPTLPLLASETASTVSSRGEYFFPVVDDKTAGRANFQVSSYDLYAPNWGISPDEQFRALEQAPFVAGEFVWTGFDYLGEPTPYNRDATNLLNFSDPGEKARFAEELTKLGKIRVPSRSSYFGIVDTAGLAKDRFYLYQAHWRPELPMAHLLPHWTWPEREGQVTPVHVYTSGDEAELFLDGRSLGRKRKAPLTYRLRWDDVVYRPGLLEVKAYKNGRLWARDRQRTAGAATTLALAPDRARIAGDGRDLAFVTVRVLDAKGTLVPRAGDTVRFQLDGPGDIVATDNGDATSHVPFQSPTRAVFNGLAVAIVRCRAPGRLSLRAEAEGLAGAAAAIGCGR